VSRAAPSLTPSARCWITALTNTSICHVIHPVRSLPANLPAVLPLAQARAHSAFPLVAHHSPQQPAWAAESCEPLAASIRATPAGVLEECSAFDARAGLPPCCQRHDRPTGLVATFGDSIRGSADRGRMASRGRSEPSVRAAPQALDYLRARFSASAAIRRHERLSEYEQPNAALADGSSGTVSAVSLPAYKFTATGANSSLILLRGRCAVATKPPAMPVPAVRR
jgi:hypothetical protein